MIIESQSPGFSEFQNIKRRFFALRNGILADQLRRAGDPHKIIFGLNLIQITEVATASEPSEDLADLLWNNVSTRESRLMAPMILPREKATVDKMQRWLESVECYEVADILCHRLLRHLPFCQELVEALAKPGVPQLQCYAGLRLALNLLNSKGADFAPCALALSEPFLDSSDVTLKSLALQMKESAGFLLQH